MRDYAEECKQYPRSYAESIFGNRQPSAWGISVGEMDMKRIEVGDLPFYPDPRTTQEKFDHAAKLIAELEGIIGNGEI